MYPKSKWRVTRFIRKNLFYSLGILVCQGGYFEFMIGVYLNIDQPIDTSSGEMASLISAWYFLIVVFFLIPYGLINLMCSPLNQINTSRKFNRKWKAFYD